MNTTRIHDIWKKLKFASETADLTEKDLAVVLPLLEKEVTAREVKRIRYLLHRSGIKRIKRLEDFDWKFNPKVPRVEIMALAKTSWDRDVKNAVFIGTSGIGKTHLAEGICVRAIENGVPATCVTCHDLVEKLKSSRNKTALVHYYATVKLLCLDELGYVFPTSEQANDIFQIVSKRSELASTIITTNLLPAHWGKIFEAATATAILDRLSYNGTFLPWEGPSYRRKK
jgi:DNA replication protein DnaC